MILLFVLFLWVILMNLASMMFISEFVLYFNQIKFFLILNDQSVLKTTEKTIQAIIKL